MFDRTDSSSADLRKQRLHDNDVGGADWGGDRVTGGQDICQDLLSTPMFLLWRTLIYASQVYECIGQVNNKQQSVKAHTF